ncbi:flagellar hook-associated protein FlgL [Desulfosediminicola flagellatus]|uniref:flagellar hook-associated protein FlgL n=1 Tax=Desulfosediminicola flagellatus TaxID=2569541 RepID=UPI0010AD798D|nr:flagellar hook-associated protein FlgL [Desulfosediminicola flagellatus]
MKVTENSTYRLMQTNLDRITNNLLEIRKNGATGLKLNKASDDPGAIRPVLTTRTQISKTERYIETMGVSLDKMETSDGHMANVENIMQRAKELTISAVNSGMNNEDLVTIADEIAELKEQLLDSANATIDGKYIFAGYEENTKPFIPNPAYDPALYDQTDSTTWPYTYQGDANPTELEITPGEYIEVNMTGNDLFMGISNANWVDSATPALGQPEANRTDLFSILTRAEEAVRAGNVDDPLGAGGSIQAQIDNLELAANQNRRVRSRMGVRAGRVESAIFHQQEVSVDLKQILSRYQDADAIETFNEIVKQESAFQAALNVTSRVSQVSILDYF